MPLRAKRGTIPGPRKVNKVKTLEGKGQRKGPEKIETLLPALTAAVESQPSPLNTCGSKKDKKGNCPGDSSPHREKD